jgi:hypothetical protein
VKKILASLLSILFISGCATAPSKPKEDPISIQLKGSAVEIQNFIEQFVSETYGKTATGLKITNADNRSITFQTDCMNVTTSGVMMNSLKCTMIMMAIGNTGWNGPYLTITYRTNEIKGVTNVKSESKWCATNVLGSSNCMTYNVADSNQNLRELKISFEKK